MGKGGGEIICLVRKKGVVFDLPRGKNTNFTITASQGREGGDNHSLPPQEKKTFFRWTKSENLILHPPQGKERGRSSPSGGENVPFSEGGREDEVLHPCERVLSFLERKREKEGRVTLNRIIRVDKNLRRESSLCPIRTEKSAVDRRGRVVKASPYLNQGGTSPWQRGKSRRNSISRKATTTTY